MHDNYGGCCRRSSSLPNAVHALHILQLLDVGMHIYLRPYVLATQFLLQSRTIAKRVKITAGANIMRSSVLKCFTQAF